MVSSTPSSPTGSRATKGERITSSSGAATLYESASGRAFTTPTSSPQRTRRSPAHPSTTEPPNASLFQQQADDSQTQQLREGITRFFYPVRETTPDRRNRIVGSFQRDSIAATSSPPRQACDSATKGLDPVAESTGLTPTNAPPLNDGGGSGIFYTPPPIPSHDIDNQEARDDADFRFRLWRTYDDIIILSIFTQIGILFRLAAATWFTYFDGVFSEGSALFVVLPMNCLSCFIMGLLCSGERLMEIVMTRFSPPRLQQDVFHEAEEYAEETALEDQENEAMVVAHDFEKGSRAANLMRRLRRRRRNKQRRKKTDRYFHSWEPPVHLNQDLRDVQLLALERRMRASKCLVLFPVSKQDVDVMEHYFRKGYSSPKKEDRNHDYDPEGNRMADAHDLGFDLELSENEGSDSDDGIALPVTPQRPKRQAKQESASRHDITSSDDREEISTTQVASPNKNCDAGTAETVATEEPKQDLDLDQMLQEVHANITENVNRLSRVDMAAGWNKGTTPDEMSDDLMLGLRDGFCGALSSFSSWQSSMVSLMREGRFGEALTGYLLGIQLPLVAYRMGQTAAVYIFIWRCRWETRRDTRRGYGIRVNQDGSDSDTSDHEQDDDTAAEPALALISVRAMATAIFVVALVTQVTSLFFYNTPESQLLALSLLFSPLGVLSRWRLSRLNQWRSTFPLGTFSCNMIACALSGSLGSLLAGNPNPRQRIVLQSLVAGFGATLSSLAAFIVEVLAGVDPILFRFDGMFYAVMSVGCGMFVSFIFGSTGEWVDQTETMEQMYNYTTDDALNATDDGSSSRWLTLL